MQGRRLKDSKEVLRHIKVLSLDLYVAATERLPGARRPVPRWVGLSRAKAAYKKDVTRYRKLFLSYRHLTGVLDDLIALGYVRQHIGFTNRDTGYGRQTRIRARKKLLQLMEQFAVPREAGKTDIPEIIILRDKFGNDIEYVDTDETVQWRANLQRINDRIAGLRIRLRITDGEFHKLNRRMRDDPERGAIDYGQIQLRRIFNNGSFREGGRFYGGWWQNIPREYRPFLNINHKDAVEFDYSGLHVRMLYAIERLAIPDDPYDLDEIARNDQKEALLVMINAESHVRALRGLGRGTFRERKALLTKLQERHKPIEKYFYSGEGIKLQFLESCMAESVMLKMLAINRPILPVHDSFIMRTGLNKELEVAMNEAFVELFPHAITKIKMKELALEIEQRERGEESMEQILERARKGFDIDDRYKEFLS